MALAASRTPSVPLPSNDALATYTLLVPLYREAAVLPALVDSLLKLDYPRALLDIKLVVEDAKGKRETVDVEATARQN